MSKKFEIRHRVHQRKQKGAISVVALVIAFFAVLPLSLLGFEMSRLFLIQSELQHVLDAAALSGTAALASSPTGYTIAQQQQIAMQTAYQNFCQNSVLETNFTTLNTTANLNTAPNNANPVDQNAIINITLYDQSGVAQPTGSTTATVMRIAAAYTDHPIFLNSPNSLFASIQSLYTVRAYSTGGLPQLDLALCFDTSGSMDDTTPVQFVRREWSGITQAVHYVVVTGSDITDGFNTHTIYSLTYPPNTGTGLNCTWPQNLSFASYPNGNYTNPYIFSEGYYALGLNPLIGLRSLGTYAAGSVCPEQGRPPGNYQASLPTLTNGNGINPNVLSRGFTDMVAVPTGYTIQGAVEASRGNLNSAAYLSTSMGGTTSSNTVSPELTAAGPYTISPTAYTDYWTAVNGMAQPITDAKNAAVTFFNLMNTSANAHFMLETFSNGIGSSPTSTFVDPNNTLNLNTDATYAAGGVGSYPLPLIKLNQASNQLTACINAVQGTGGSNGLVAEGKTDIGDALHEAYKELTNAALTRPIAKKAVILFTDGIPNVTSTPYTPFQVAGLCKTKGIPIYTIGLSTNAQVVAPEALFLGDNNLGGDGSGPGIAYLSGNGATFTAVSNSAQMNAAFQQIARSLVVLQQ
jgi:Flp pilus assembly protein TadG